MKKLDLVVVALLIIGGLNLGLVGLFDFDLVAVIFGEMSALSRIIYVLVGLAAVYDVVMIKTIWKRWDIHFREPVHA